MSTEITTQFCTAMQQFGIRPPETIQDDGQLHRFTTSETHRDNAGWYVFYPDGIPMGSFGNWITGSQHTWHAEIGRTLSPQETSEHRLKIGNIRRLLKAAEEERYAKAISYLGKTHPENMSDFEPLEQEVEVKNTQQIINATIKPTTSETKLNIIRGSDFKPEPIVWIWNDWLAAGKFHILAGAPGTGKTTIALNLAATITRGGAWPDGTTCGSGNILIWSGEDDRKNTLLPRLLAHGADPKRTYFIENIEENNEARFFDPSRDIGELCKEVSKISEVRLIIIDPIVNVVAGDSHKNGEVRRALQPLVELAEKLQAVILGISHFTKGTLGHEPLERVTGSIAFGALARIVLATAKTTDPAGEVRHVLVRAKSNHGPDGGGYAYRIEQVELVDYPGILSAQAIWGDPVNGSARQLLNDTDNSETTEERSILSEAVHFLKTVLAEGAISKKEVSEKAREAGFKEPTLRRAKTFLGVEAIHEGYGKGSLWKWYLPSRMYNHSEEKP